MKSIAPDKVVGNAIREPINRQAALIMRKCPEQFRPQPSADLEELNRLRAENNTMKQKIITQAQELKLINMRLQKLKQELNESKERMRAAISAGEEQCKKLQGKQLQERQKILKKHKIMGELMGMNDPVKMVAIKSGITQYGFIQD